MSCAILRIQSKFLCYSYECCIVPLSFSLLFIYFVPVRNLPSFPVFLSFCFPFVTYLQFAPEQEISSPLTLSVLLVSPEIGPADRPTVQCSVTTSLLPSTSPQAARNFL